jgi:hypothetical protein
VNRAPDEVLPWLAQLVGVIIQPGDTTAQRRAAVLAAAGIKRGTVASMISAAQKYLTGTKFVAFFERTSDAWHFSVRTRTVETPSSAAVLAALIAAKPAGLILDYVTFTGVLYADTTAAFASYSATTAAKATYTIRSS